MPPAVTSDRNGLVPFQSLSVEGFKSIDGEQSIELRPLTILAGANSSGKSSVMQPLLLVKQTLEAPYDPGPLLINGANVRFTRVEQLLNKRRMEREHDQVAFGFAFGDLDQCKVTFRRSKGYPLVIEDVFRKWDDLVVTLREGESALEENPQFGSLIRERLATLGPPPRTASVYRLRCFLDVQAQFGTPPIIWLPVFPNLYARYQRAIMAAIHVPGLRGNPLRTYPLTAVGERFPGTFEEYVASVIAARRADASWMGQLSQDLSTLGLTRSVEARAVDDAHVEIRVDRLPAGHNGAAEDMVSIADVGFGVSQTLPVVVALLAARPGQIVYLEQPEIHLHPRAQHAMARLLARAAKRGVRVVAETHSSLLLLGVQSLVAEGELDPGLVKLHWFQRDPESGTTQITSRDVDAAGRFPDWPVDFDEVSLEAQMAYLNAAEKRVAGE